MLYLLAVLVPPLAVLFIGRPFQALVNLLLCLFLWVPGIIHAVVLVHDHKSKKYLREELSRRRS